MSPDQSASWLRDTPLPPADADGAVRAELGRILDAGPVRAGAFIVTLYGDVVAPWGGVAWMGNVITVCGEVGISETLVRTSVSRLVASGLLEGERVGRRSYYRLTATAAADFAAAAAVLFGPPPPAESDWLIMVAGEPGQEIETTEPARVGRLAPRVTIVPLAAEAPLPDRLPAGAVAFRATAADPRTLARLAPGWWRLDECADGYRAFAARFDRLGRLLAAPGIADRTCLVARLLLVHHYRTVALADPRLPASALPADWPGGPARRLFADLYQRLALPAEREVARRFVDRRGPLRPERGTMQDRLTGLGRVG